MCREQAGKRKERQRHDADTSGGVRSLVHRHKPGVSYSVTCRLASETNLEWRDYEFRGTMKKPAGAVYDSIGLGAIVYMVAPDRYYILKVNGFNAADTGDNRFRLYSRNGSTETVLDTLTAFSFSGDTDEVNFAVQVTTDTLMSGDSVIVDGKTTMRAKVWKVGSVEQEWSLVTQKSDTGTGRKRDGHAAVTVDMQHVGQPGETSGIRLTDMTVRKLR